MMWSYWICLYIRTHCVARGLRPQTLAAYEATLEQFREWVQISCSQCPPDRLPARDILRYLQHLRDARGNGDSAINRTAVVLRGFYRAIVAMGHLPPADNPMAAFPSIKAVPRKLPIHLTPEQVARLLQGPASNTIVGLRDAAILALLYGTGIRASECASLRNGQVDLLHLTIRVNGKGGHERSIPLNPRLAEIMRLYAQARGAALPHAPFFRSRFGAALTRAAVYERVRTWGQRTRVSTQLSPHKLRHSFATHLVRAGVGLVTIRDLLGHRQITSTQIYLHVTAEDLRQAAARHPIAELIGTVAHLLPHIRLPFQRARASGLG